MKPTEPNDHVPWIKRKGNLVQIDTDRMPADMEEEAQRIVAEHNHSPIFTGTVEHGYPLAAVKDPKLCPTCGGKTLEHSADFIYATSKGTRVMFTAAGRFCESCPTVIVNEQLIEQGMVVSNVTFRRVVGVVNAKTKDPMYFGTWRGEKPVYMVDENGQIEDMLTESEMEAAEKRARSPSPATAAREDRQKKKAKRKQARKARKMNRVGRKK